MSLLTIDGAQGEGGGQILRTAVSLSAVCGRPVRVVNIRAKRSKPGLLRQHLTAVRAAAELCDAKVTGADVSSRELAFHPGKVRGGAHTFAVGTAGSASLVCQTVLPIVLTATEPSDLTFEGGTHNPLAPPYDFLEHAFFPILRRMGANIEAELLRPGFYPAGGGAFRLRVEPGRLQSVDLLDAGPVRRLTAWATFAKLPFHVAERELSVLQDALDLSADACRPREVDSAGPGNTLSVKIERDVTALITGFGAPGRPAEEVANGVVRKVKEHLHANAPVGAYLADQLLIPFAIAGGGSFRTGPTSAHTKTNASVIRGFGEHEVEIEEQGDGSVVARVRR